MAVEASATSIYISDWNKAKLVKPTPDGATTTPAATLSTAGSDMPF